MTHSEHRDTPLFITSKPESAAIYKQLLRPLRRGTPLTFVLLVSVREKARTEENGMLAVFLSYCVNRLVHLRGFFYFSRNPEQNPLPHGAVLKVGEHDTG